MVKLWLAALIVTLALVCINAAWTDAEGTDAERTDAERTDADWTDGEIMEELEERAKKGGNAKKSGGKGGKQGNKKNNQKPNKKNNQRPNKQKPNKQNQAPRPKPVYIMPMPSGSSSGGNGSDTKELRDGLNSVKAKHMLAADQIQKQGSTLMKHEQKIYALRNTSNLKDEQMNIKIAKLESDVENLQRVPADPCKHVKCPESSECKWGRCECMNQAGQEYYMANGKCVACAPGFIKKGSVCIKYLPKTNSGKYRHAQAVSACSALSTTKYSVELISFTSQYQGSSIGIYLYEEEMVNNFWLNLKIDASSGIPRWLWGNGVKFAFTDQSNNPINLGDSECGVYSVREEDQGGSMETITQFVSGSCTSPSETVCQQSATIPKDPCKDITCPENSICSGLAGTCECTNQGGKEYYMKDGKCVECAPGFVKVGSICIKYIPSASQSSVEAETACSSLSTDNYTVELISFTSQSQGQVIGRYLADTEMLGMNLNLYVNLKQDRSMMSSGGGVRWLWGNGVKFAFLRDGLPMVLGDEESRQCAFLRVKKLSESGMTGLELYYLPTVCDFKAQGRQTLCQQM